MVEPICRTNAAERKVAGAFQQRGWTILTRGWPDFLIIKEEHKSRLIEVKPDHNYNLKKSQQLVADILKRDYGIEVELVTVDDLDDPLLFL